MKAFLVLLSLSLVLSLPPLPTPSNLKDFLIGNLVSLQVVQSVPDGFSCATNVASLHNNTKTALDLFMHGHFVDALHMIETTINDTITSCEKANAEGKLLFENFIRIILDPEFVPTAFARIKDNQLTILEDLAEGFEDLNNQSYFTAGIAFGKIPHLVLSGPDGLSLNFLEIPNNISTPLMNFTRGFLEALQVWSSIPDGLNCINGIADFKDELAQILALVKQLKIIEAITLMNQMIGTEFLSCTNAIAENVQLFKEFLQNVSQPGFIDAAKGRIEDNLLTLMGDFQNGVSAMGAKDYYAAGVAFGHIPHVALSGL